MLKLNAIALLEKKGKTKYWLYKQLGMSYQNFNKMINNETKSVQYENLEVFQRLGQLTVALLAVDSYVGPFHGRAVIGGAGLLLGILRLGQEPADDTDSCRVKIVTVDSLQPFGWQTVEIVVDMILIEGVQGIVAAAETDGRNVKGKAGKFLHIVVLNMGHALFDPVFNVSIIQFHDDSLFVYRIWQNSMGSPVGLMILKYLIPFSQKVGMDWMPSSSKV